jgi:hypothetical protein
MRPMPKPPGTEGISHEAAVDALQKWIWQCILAGWTPGQGNSERWGHDDNMAVQQRGWMIASPPGSDVLDLFSLKRGVNPHEFMPSIVAAAPIDPHCAKAVGVLGAQRLKHPEYKFAFDKGNAK